MLAERPDGLTPVSTRTAPPAAPRQRLRPAESVARMARRPGVSPLVLSGLARAAEFLLVALTGAMITWLYIPADIPVSREYWVALPGVALLTIVVLQSLDLYQISALRAFAANGARVALGFGFVFLCLFALVFFLKLEGVFSRGVFGLWFLVGLAVLLLVRFGFYMLIRELSARGLMDRRAVIVGGGPPGAALLEALAHSQNSDIRICGVFDERNDDRSPDLVAGYPKLGGVDELLAYARNTRLDMIIFTLPVTAEARILEMLKKLWVLPVDIRLAAHTQKLRFRPRNYSYIGSLPMFDMADRPVRDWGHVLKTAMDRVLGLALLLALSPLFLLIAIAIKLDSPGPVFFRQKRYGFNNKLIEIFKFRSMYVDKADATAARLVTRDDPRVTRVGRFLRKASLDELPQLINVAIKGDLSLVGPRPHAVHAKAEDRLYDEVVEGYFARHRVKPGMSGWAQINGWRGETDTHEKIQRRVEHDLYYIENWSLAFDLYILIRTPFALINSENAY
jgi:Undecaprenyl-phosphate glucose phosphotransferase